MPALDLKKNITGISSPTHFFYPQYYFGYMTIESEYNSKFKVQLTLAKPRDQEQ